MVLGTFGSITKEEKVKSLDVGLANTLVLENLGLFPGYYGSKVTQTSMPDSLFLIITKKEPTERIFRLSQLIKKQSEIDFEGTPAVVSVFNTEYYAIRIRKLSSFDQVPVIQEFFKDFGIEFAKAKTIDENAVIHVTRIFQIEQLSERIWKDDERNMFYLKLNQHLSWSLFRKVVTQLRNNIELTGFDAALAVFYGAEMYDVIRIYTKTLTLEQLQELQEKFDSIIEKVI